MVIRCVGNPFLYRYNRVTRLLPTATPVRQHYFLVFEVISQIWHIEIIRLNTLLSEKFQEIVL